VLIMNIIMKKVLSVDFVLDKIKSSQFLQDLKNEKNRNI
jgi:hypothetical protein